jgi:hypothetical protein
MRTLIAKTRLRANQTPTPDLMIKTYATTMRMAAEDMLDRWANATVPPEGSPHIRAAKAMRGTEHVGFNVWLIAGEPVRLGGEAIEEEQVED